MKNKISLIVLLILSVLFININEVYCVEVTDDSSNMSITANGQTKTWVNDGITGNEMQAIKVTVYRKNGSKVPGTNSVYIKLKDGYGNNIVNTCTCGDTYSLDNVPNKNKCSCTKNTTVNVISVSGITGSQKYWATKSIYDTNAPALTTLLTSNNYSNVYSILEKVGYKTGASYKYQQGDYLIVEPYVTVSCTNFAGVTKANAKKYISGTINSLVGANMSFLNGQTCGQTVTSWVTYNLPAGFTTLPSGQIIINYKEIKFPKSISEQKHLYKWVYSAIGQSFKVSGASCQGSEYSSTHKFYLLNKDNYKGCGYNKFLLDEVPGINKTRYVCQQVDGNYYDINGNNLYKDQTTQVASCTCFTKDGKKYLTYSDYVNNKATDDTTYRNTCGGAGGGYTCYDKIGAPSRTGRIKIYYKCKDEGCIATVGDTVEKKGDYRNILDFTKFSCTPGSDYQLIKSCLKVDSVDEFNYSNLSKYTDTIDVMDNYTGKTVTYTVFCQSAYKLTSNVVKNPWSTASGMAYLGGTTSPETIATATLTRKCILYLDKITDENKNNELINKYKAKDYIGNFKYEDAIGNVTLGGVVLPYTVSESALKVENGKIAQYNNYFVYTKTYTATYKTPLVYIDSTTGRVTNNPANSVKKYGLYTNFSDSGTYPVGFNVEIKNKNITVANYGDCAYEAIKPITDLKIEFRTIDTNNPFLGENGTTRNTGINWCDDDNCSYNNSVVTNTISNKNNSYNRTGEGPIYRFVLTPQTINTIRNSNSVTAKTNNNTKCSLSDTKCKSNFFKSINGSITTGANKLVS